MGVNWSMAEDTILLDACKRLNPSGVIALNQIETLIAEVMPHLPERNARALVRKGRALGCIEYSPYKIDRPRKKITAEDRFARVMAATNNGHAFR